MTQRVLVTAEARGIGKEIARAFVASGAKACVCDIDEAALKAPPRTFRALSPRSVIFRNVKTSSTWSLAPSMHSVGSMCW
jgi:NAD(P)-dependent dehydrogenase (short-subunit alcohol dehydrogenase family)